MGALLPGAEPFAAEGDGGVGALLLHGFTGNPSSMRPLATHLAAAGFAVELPRLPGHGTTWRELQRTRWPDWVREAQAALTILAARTRQQVVVGLSMGGTIALHLLETDARPAGGVVINPLVDPTDPRLKALPALKWVVPSLRGVGGDVARPGAVETAYDRMPLRALASLIELQRSVRERLPVVTRPLLVLTSAVDHVVDPADSTLVVDRVAGPCEQVVLEHSYHVATLDYDADVIAARTEAFLRRAAAPLGESREA